MPKLLSHRALAALAALAFTLTAGACGNDPVSSTQIAGSFVVASGSPQSVLTGAVSAPLVVRVLDQRLRPMEGVTVNWSITSTIVGSLVANTTTTNADGEASVVANAGLTPGLLTVRATIEGQSPLSFAITITAPAGQDPQALRSGIQ